MDVARYGDWATMAYTNTKVCENYSRRFRIRFPNEELPAARPQQTTALYDLIVSQGAVMGDSWGLETPLWFAPKGVEPKETPTFRRSNAFPHVAEECRAVRERVGVLEIANFAKYEITGKGAEAYLDRLLANRLPPTGRLALTPMLSPKGRLYGDLTVGRLADDRFVIFGSGGAQSVHMRWFHKHLPPSGVTVRNRNMELHGLSISGPRARDLLAKLTSADVSAAAFRFRDLREMDVAGIPAIVARLSFSGELGYEIYVAPEYQVALFEAVMGEGKDLDPRLYGWRALYSLRLEKNYGIWTYDFKADFTAAESGLDPFVRFDKGADFIGRAAAMAEHNSGPKQRLVTLAVDVAETDANRDEPIFHGGRCVGFVTSGGFAHYTKTSIAMGYVPAELAKPGAEFQVEILGDFRNARLLAEPLYDPKGLRMRG
jgi:dimethylglycine dehydrogenase